MASLKRNGWPCQPKSTVQTARANGVKVEENLKYTIENIDKLSLEKLLPRHKDLPDELRIHPEDTK